jgi:hypothetical protein
MYISEIYAGDQKMWKPMKSSLNKTAEQEGFQLGVYKNKSGKTNKNPDDQKESEDEQEVEKKWRRQCGVYDELFQKTFVF